MILTFNIIVTRTQKEKSERTMIFTNVVYMIYYTDHKEDASKAKFDDIGVLQPDSSKYISNIVLMLKTTVKVIHLFSMQNYKK